MCIMAGCVILSIGAALQCSAYGIPQLIVGRVIAGVGNGLNTSTIREFRALRPIFLFLILRQLFGIPS